MKEYLVVFAQAFMPFRLPELVSVVEMSNIKMECKSQYSDHHPYMLVLLEGQREVQLILDRCVLVVHVIEIWITAESRDELRTKVAFCSQPQYSDCTFNILLHSFGRKVSLQQKVALIESMPDLPLRGKVCCKQPDEIFYICENYPGHVPPAEPTHVYFGRWIGSGQRTVIDRYSVKKRSYIGRTSMDAQLSFIMANQAQIKKHDLVYDPFLGTGSLLIPVAHFGGVTFGSDIDIKALRGWGKSTRKGEKQYQSHQSVAGNMKEYGLDQGYLGSFGADFQAPLLRHKPLFDAIVTDPPYGIREAALKITKDNQTSGLVDYSLSDQYLDLITFAAIHLVLGGVLVYWLPVVPDKYSEDCVPLHPALQITANSEQGLSKKAARRLITMVKRREVSAEDRSYIPGDRECHNTFRQDYFMPGS